jgi:hypothetical protein
VKENEEKVEKTLRALNCSFWHSGQRSAASFLTGAGTPLLGYKRGVPVAQPCVEFGEEIEAKDIKDIKVIATLITSISITFSVNRVGRPL